MTSKDDPGRLAGVSLGAKLILFSSLLTVLAVGLTFAALSFEIRRQTRRLLADTLAHHQRRILDVQRSERDQLLYLSRLMTESPTLRAAMETFETERGGLAVPRADLIATVQVEVERISAGLDHDLLLVTDGRGIVLAAGGGIGAALVGADLSAAPVLRQALDPEAPEGAGEFAILSVGGRPFQVGCVPILLQGFTIGALALGDGLDDHLALKLGTSIGSDVVIAVGGKVIGATPAIKDAAAHVARAVGVAGGPGRPSALVPVDGREYVAGSLPLGVDASGQPATLYLLHSLTGALGPANRALLVALLIYGTCAAALAGLLSWLMSRSILDPLERFVAFLRDVAQSGDHARRFRIPLAGPEMRTLSVTYNQLMDSLSGHEQRLLLRAREDLERMQRLQESEKLAALGRMLSGAAHEINNPLTGVLGNIELLLGDQGLAPAVRERLERVRKEGARIVGLVRNLLKTAHRDSGERSLVDLNQVVRECAALRRHDFAAAGMALRLETAASPCRVMGSELELQQVILNILNNAYDALKEGTQGPDVTARTVLTENGVMLEFLDNGPGMKEPQRVFEHFYTTKEIGKGTGLGLSITHAIVQHHGGQIAAENRPGGGARFVITLPKALESRTGSAAPGPSPAPDGSAAEATTVDQDGGSPTRGVQPLQASVLVVDDEPSVLDLQLAILESAGARAVGVRSGAAAIEALQKGEFDLVVSDLKMPGEVSGQDLYQWVETHRPAAARRFVFVTGDTVAEGTQAFLQRSRRRCVQKPFDIEAYLAALKETWDEQKAA